MITGTSVSKDEDDEADIQYGIPSGEKCWLELEQNSRVANINRGCGSTVAANRCDQFLLIISMCVLGKWENHVRRFGFRKDKVETPSGNHLQDPFPVLSYFSGFGLLLQKKISNLTFKSKWCKENMSHVFPTAVDRRLTLTLKEI